VAIGELKRTFGSVATGPRQRQCGGRPVEVYAYADRLVIRQDGRVVAEHARSFGRGKAIYDPWHYVPVLARKPGALRNGAPFKDWVLPTALGRVRRKLAGSNDGDRQMDAILATVLTDGLPAFEAACARALAEGVHSADVIINILSRRDPGPAATILTREALTLRHALATRPNLPAVAHRDPPRVPASASSWALRTARVPPMDYCCKRNDRGQFWAQTLKRPD